MRRGLRLPAGALKKGDIRCKFTQNDPLTKINGLFFQGNRIKIREEKYRIHHADMMVANRSIQICIPEVIKIS